MNKPQRDNDTHRVVDLSARLGHEHLIGYIYCAGRYKDRNAVAFRHVMDRQQLTDPNCSIAFTESSPAQCRDQSMIVVVSDAGVLAPLLKRAFPTRGSAGLQREFNTMCECGGLQTIAPCQAGEVPLLAITVAEDHKVYRMVGEVQVIGSANVLPIGLAELAELARNDCFPGIET